MRQDLSRSGSLHKKGRGTHEDDWSLSDTLGNKVEMVSAYVLPVVLVGLVVRTETVLLFWRSSDTFSGAAPTPPTPQVYRHRGLRLRE